MKTLKIAFFSNGYICEQLKTKVREVLDIFKRQYHIEILPSGNRTFDRLVLAAAAAPSLPAVTWEEDRAGTLRLNDGGANDPRIDPRETIRRADLLVFDVPRIDRTFLDYAQSLGKDIITL